MSTGVNLPKQFIYPAAAIVSSFWLTAYQTVNVGRKRRAADIKFPQLYAEKAEAEASREANIFNCAQRAHQSTLEYLPVIITSTLITSLRHPVLAASLCGAWTTARFFYTIGYTTGDPDKVDVLIGVTEGDAETISQRNFMGGVVVMQLGWVGLILGSTWSVSQLLCDAL
ncbi:hypothetical protein AcV5_005165 [Taiwanofungus camphoratus]|nr:hypothetical protein AcV5_005165 [Antrodia cinnamomea]